MAAVSWLLVVLAGTALMAQYSQTAGASGTPPQTWPATDEEIAEPSTHCRLILFLHPRCSCSRATLGELEQLVAHCQNLFTAQVWFIQPEGMTADWVQTDLWRAAAAIPGVRVGIDREGTEARRFQASTSGETLLYDEAGKLAFHGGITLARGHSGDNPGRDAIESFLTKKMTPVRSTPVFGCALGWKNNPEICPSCQP